MTCEPSVILSAAKDLPVLFNQPTADPSLTLGMTSHLRFQFFAFSAGPRATAEQ